MKILKKEKTGNNFELEVEIEFETYKKARNRTKTLYDPGGQRRARPDYTETNAYSRQKGSGNVDRFTHD